MNEPSPFNRKLLKALFRRLVKDAGGVEACGVELGISHQRVSQIANVNNDEMAKELPTWEQVWRLESVIGRSVVFAALADAIKPAPAPANACPTKETHDLVQAAAAMLPLAAALDPADPKTLEAFNAGMARLQKEAAEANAAANVVLLASVGGR